jgi:hypothetical protein
LLVTEYVCLSDEIKNDIAGWPSGGVVLTKETMQYVFEKYYLGTARVARFGNHVLHEIYAAIGELLPLVYVSWLSIHRISSTARRSEESSFESSIDLKIQ